MSEMPFAFCVSAGLRNVGVTLSVGIVSRCNTRTMRSLYRQHDRSRVPFFNVALLLEIVMEFALHKERSA